MGSDSRGLRTLDETDCRALLRAAQIGRVVVSMDAMPAAFPVNYVVIGSEIYFRTAAGTKLTAAVNRTVVAFQVDEFEPSGTGWSVLAVGRARVVTEPAERALLNAAGLHSWVVTADPHYVAIGIERITGRRLTSAGSVAPAGRAPWPVP